MIGFAGAANAPDGRHPRCPSILPVLRAVVNYKIDDEENIRNIERLREDRRFNEKSAENARQAEQQPQQKHHQPESFADLEQAGKDLYNLLD